MNCPQLSHILRCGFVTLFFVTLFAAQDRAPASPALPAPFKKWLDEDVAYIITDEERADFAKLETDAQRYKFIEDFWQRRNPSATPEANPFKEEHYRRIAYAADRFAYSRVPGWQTDCGRVYIIYGPPDEREVHPANTSPNLPPDASPTRRYRNEVWRYNFIEGLGRNIFFDFVDKCDCGEYPLNHDPTKRRLRQSQNKEKMLRQVLRGSAEQIVIR